MVQQTLVRIGPIFIRFASKKLTTLRNIEINNTVPVYVLLWLLMCLSNINVFPSNFMRYLSGSFLRIWVEKQKRNCAARILNVLFLIAKYVFPQQKKKATMIYILYRHVQDNLLQPPKKVRFMWTTVVERISILRTPFQRSGSTRLSIIFFRFFS